MGVSLEILEKLRFLKGNDLSRWICLKKNYRKLGEGDIDVSFGFGFVE